jgi:hypothetical protein
MVNIVVDIASPPDRERLVAQLMIGNEQLAELNQEGQLLQLEIYCRRDGQPWIVGYTELLRALADAREKLGHSS